MNLLHHTEIIKTNPKNILEVGRINANNEIIVTTQPIINFFSLPESRKISEERTNCAVAVDIYEVYYIKAIDK